VGLRDDGQRVVQTSSGAEIVTDAVLIATGRLPNTGDLGLSRTAAEVGPRGQVLVDAFGQTAEPGLHAVGDVTDRIHLTPVAIHDATCFVSTVFGDNPRTPDHSDVATAVFSQPEVGVVGMTEAEAARTHSLVRVYATRFRPMKAALSGSPHRMLIKLVTAGVEERLVGAHLVGDGAAEMVQLLAIAVKAKLTKAQIDATMPLHPTAAEEIVTMPTPVRSYQGGVAAAA
jgi:glutathione reductase (NADPH)